MARPKHSLSEYLADRVAFRIKLHTARRAVQGPWFAGIPREALARCVATHKTPFATAPVTAWYLPTINNDDL